MFMFSDLFCRSARSRTMYAIDQLEQRLVLSAVGNPIAGNGWEAISAITVTASSTHASFYLPAYTVRGNNNTINPNIFDSTGQLVQGPRPTNTPPNTSPYWLSDSGGPTSPAGSNSFSAWIEFSF